MKFEHVDIEQNYIHTHVRIIQRNGLKMCGKFLKFISKLF